MRSRPRLQLATSASPRMPLIMAHRVGLLTYLLAPPSAARPITSVLWQRPPMAVRTSGRDRHRPVVRRCVWVHQRGVRRGFTASRRRLAVPEFRQLRDVNRNRRRDGVLGAAGQLAASGTGDAIVLSGSRFVNSAGAGALTAANGRWLVWSSNPNPFGGATPDNRGGLAYDFKQYNAFFGVTPPAQAPATASSTPWRRPSRRV